MTDLVVVCECGRRLTRSHLSQHLQSYYHEWKMERRKALGLHRVNEHSKVVEILEALGAKIVRLKTRARFNRFGKVYRLSWASWVDEFHGSIATILWMNLPWRKALQVAKTLVKDPGRMVLLRLAGDSDGTQVDRTEILARVATEMGFKWKYWDESWDFRTPDEIEQDEALQGLMCRR